MSRIKYRLYDTVAEIIAYTDSSGEALELEFDGEAKGYVKLGDRTAALKDGKCCFKTAELREEEYRPFLVIEGASIALPAIVRNGMRFSPLPPDEEYIRNLSLRTLALQKRVKELEAFAEEIRKKVYGTTIF